MKLIHWIIIGALCALPVHCEDSILYTIAKQIGLNDIFESDHCPREADCGTCVNMGWEFHDAIPSFSLGYHICLEIGASVPRGYLVKRKVVNLEHCEPAHPPVAKITCEHRADCFDCVTNGCEFHLAMEKFSDYPSVCLMPEEPLPRNFLIQKVYMDEDGCNLMEKKLNESAAAKKAADDERREDSAAMVLYASLGVSIASLLLGIGTTIWCVMRKRRFRSIRYANPYNLMPYRETVTMRSLLEHENEELDRQRTIELEEILRDTGRAPLYPAPEEQEEERML